MHDLRKQLEDAEYRWFFRLYSGYSSPCSRFHLIHSILKVSKDKILLLNSVGCFFVVVVAVF